MKIAPILFLYFEESLVSSNLNSKQLRFHYVRPIVHTCLRLNSYYSWQESQNDRCRKRFHCVLDKWLMINEGNSTHLKRKYWIQGQNDSTLLIRMFESQTKSLYISCALSYFYYQAQQKSQGHGGSPHPLTLFQSRGQLGLSPRATYWRPCNPGKC